MQLHALNTQQLLRPVPASSKMLGVTAGRRFCLINPQIMNGKKSIKKSSRNHPVKKSIRLVKARKYQLHLKESND